MGLDEPLSDAAAGALARRILERGVVVFSGHALDEMASDALQRGDVLNVLRSGWVEGADLERGTWRYRVVTNAMAVVMAFRSEHRLVVVTAWRF